MTTPDLQLAADTSLRRRARNRFGPISPETGDAVLYAASAIFALITIVGSSLALYRQWAELAIGPFVFGAVCSAVLAVVAGAARAKPTTRHRRGGEGLEAEVASP